MQGRRCAHSLLRVFLRICIVLGCHFGGMRVNGEHGFLPARGLEDDPCWFALPLGSGALGIGHLPIFGFAEFLLHHRFLSSQLRNYGENAFAIIGDAAIAGKVAKPNGLRVEGIEQGQGLWEKFSRWCDPPSATRRAATSSDVFCSLDLPATSRSIDRLCG